MIYKSQKGFTLVELSIVLVIVGLIVSGVLAGKDLIKASELRATVRQYQEFQVGVNTFMGKYNGIPGDVNGTKYGFSGGCTGTANLGDGDGLIESAAGNVAVHDGEIACFWANLTTDGRELIKGAYNGYDGSPGAGSDIVGLNMPKLRFGSTGWGVYNDGSDNWFTTGVIGSHATGLYASTFDFIPINAADIDSKIDDGIPNAGAVQARDAHATVINTAASGGVAGTTTVCVDTDATPNDYQYIAESKLCRLIIKMHSF